MYICILDICSQSIIQFLCTKNVQVILNKYDFFLSNRSALHRPYGLFSHIYLSQSIEQPQTKIKRNTIMGHPHLHVYRIVGGLPETVNIVPSLCITIIQCTIWYNQRNTPPPEEDRFDNASQASM